MRLRVVALAVGVLAVLVGFGPGQAEAQRTPSATVTMSVTAGDQRFTLSPDASGEAAIEVPLDTPVLFTAAIEGNLTELGAYQLQIGAANGRGFAVGCGNPCTSTQVRVDGKPGQRSAMQAVVTVSGHHVAVSPVVSVTWGTVPQGSGGKSAPASKAALPERGEPAPLWAVAIVVSIGALLIIALAPMSMGRR